MGAPVSIRSTAGFRKFQFFELNASFYPIGSVTLEPMTPYTIASGSSISGSTVAVAAGTAVSGSVAYYGMAHSGAKVLTINDPQPRVIPHIGDDGVFALQVLPPLEPMAGELRVDKTNDTIDALAGGIKKFTIGEANFLGVSTNKRGFEAQVGALAYAAGEDTDPNSANFGGVLWDFRIFPKVNLFMRDTGYAQEVNERMYSFTPMYVTSHIWQKQFTEAVEGFVRAQALRGVSQYKPTICSFLGNGVATGFPFDSAQPAASAAKIVVWVNGVLQSTGYSASTSGVSFAVAPAANAVIVVFYEQ